MDTPGDGSQEVDGYIAGFPVEVQDRLQAIRRLIREIAPHGREKITYRIPTLVVHRNVLHYAGFERHIGMYPAPRGDQGLDVELAPYRSGTGTLRFPLDRPLPMDLIGRVIELRVADDLRRANERKRRRRSE
jgi:uncharacterized protein YdhG (YjbR/CyaY superfamily)